MPERIDTNIKTTYTPLQAARFLGIELDRLEEMTQKGELRRFRGKTCGPWFYLGGELDVMKSFMTEHLRPKFRVEKIQSSPEAKTIKVDGAKSFCVNGKKYSTKEEALAARRVQDKLRRASRKTRLSKARQEAIEQESIEAANRKLSIQLVVQESVFAA